MILYEVLDLQHVIACDAFSFFAINPCYLLIACDNPCLRDGRTGLVAQNSSRIDSSFFEAGCVGSLISPKIKEPDIRMPNSSEFLHLGITNQF
jgi:hypothetical protein